MKHFSLMFIMLILLISCTNNNTEIVKDRYDSGEIRIKNIYQKGEENTETYLKKQYYKNGNIEAEGMYINGKQSGEWKWWWNNGNLKDLAYFDCGYYVDQRKHWFENGNISGVEFFDIPMHKDSCCEFFTGNTVMYTEEGFRQECYLKKGKFQGKATEYYPNGKVSFTGFFINDIKNGEWTYYDSLGVVEKVELYDNGMMK